MDTVREDWFAVTKTQQGQEQTLYVSLLHHFHFPSVVLGLIAKHTAPSSPDSFTHWSLSLLTQTDSAALGWTEGEESVT